MYELFRNEVTKPDLSQHLSISLHHLYTGTDTYVPDNDNYYKSYVSARESSCANNPADMHVFEGCLTMCHATGGSRIFSPPGHDMHGYFMIM